MIIKLPAFYDVSHWKEILDFELVSPRPLLFGTKATEGTGFVDAKFVRFFEGMKQIGVRRLAYHFHRKALDPTAQAQHFVNTIRPHITDLDILALDVEENGESAAQLKTWCEVVSRALPRNPLWIYSRKNILESIPTFLYALFSKMIDRVGAGYSALDTIQMTLAEREFFKDIPTWVAGYPFNPDQYSSVPDFYIPDQTKWGPVYGWQYSAQGRVAGIDGNVDLNWLSPVAIALLSEPTPPPAGETMFNLTVIATHLNGRMLPNGTINFPAGVGFATGFRKDDVLEAAEVFLDPNGITKWYRITKCTRAGVDVTLPALVFASDGGTAGYLRVDVAPPPVATVIDVDIHLAPGSTVTTKKSDGSTEVETA